MCAPGIFKGWNGDLGNKTYVYTEYMFLALLIYIVTIYMNVCLSILMYMFTNVFFSKKEK